MLTDREFATLIWLGLIVVSIAIVPKWRRSIGPSALQVVKAAVSKWILLSFGLFLVWCAAWVALAWRLGAWNLDLLKDTVIIVLTVGFPLLFRSATADSATEIVRQITSETVALSALLLFYLNLEPFPLWAELIAQPVIVFLSLLHFVAGRQPNGKPLQGCLGVILVIVGLGIITWTTTQFISHAAGQDWRALLLSLALSIWLPIVMFPYFYGAAFFAATQLIVQRLRKWNKPLASRRAALAVVLGFRGRLRYAQAFKFEQERRFRGIKKFREARSLMRDFRDTVGSA